MHRRNNNNKRTCGEGSTVEVVSLEWSASLVTLRMCVWADALGEREPHRLLRHARFANLRRRSDGIAAYL